MYTIQSTFSDYTTDGENRRMFKTYDEALLAAEDRAGRDYDGITIYVNEVKAVVKSNPVKVPVKTAIVTDENVGQLLLGESDENS